ncbi:hypothetical protein C8R48DRAFT_716310 [Suillus tomentosus]|nr:hypothetical protein C8R48DRAFT_716310 [Suillus tomentosus]
MHDENFSVIRSFHSSALRQEYSPNTERSYFPSLCEPKSTVGCGPSLWRAEREVGVGAMRVCSPSRMSDLSYGTACIVSVEFQC